MHNPVNFVDPFGLAGDDCGNALEQESKLAKEDRARRHTSSSAKYKKHTLARTQEEAKGLSSKGGAAQYWDESIGHGKITGDQATKFRNKIEKEALQKGTYSPQSGGSDYYIYDSGRNIGYNNGKPTQYMRVEVTNSTNEFHGHPISAQDYNGYLKKVK
ncbi:hypothetical protein [Xenorhabdus taiwanensis]|uniref:Uncharacterized protein n=1 Tax=Xenorhabdus taiwanensis TaxID=3085177 RepID=A0ABM8JSF7_9GAMM|nr:hypothetical protein TCT1_01970 [Xenorhabdus sp. TCT-1]